MIAVVFKPEHLDKLEIKSVHVGEVPTTVMTEAVTFMEKDLPVAVFGAFAYTPGVVHFWGLVSENVRQKPLAFHRLASHLLRHYEKHQKVRRIQIDVRADYVEGQRWARSLDFVYEGTMKKFGQRGEDFHLYARTN